MHARSALFTLLGDVVRPSGGVAWLSILTECMAVLDFTPQATRTALHRMAGEGWVAPSRSGRYAAYRLTDRGVRRLDAAALRIYRLRAADWDGRWRMIHTPGPVRDAAAVKALRWWGHGPLDRRWWVSPHGGGAGALDLPPGTLHFETSPAEDPDRDRDVVRRAWDLEGIHRAHAAFLDAWPADPPSAEPRRAFAARIRLVHHWRSFLFLDPGLPYGLLPDDWLGQCAARRFRALWERLEAPAWDFYDDIARGRPAPPGLQPPRRHLTPFSIGDSVETPPPAPSVSPPDTPVAPAPHDLDAPGARRAS